MTDWSPRAVVPLVQVIDTCSLVGLRPGAPAERIAETLGPPELPPAKLGKRSTLWSHVYGNVTLLVEAGKIEQIQIDFEGPRTRTVAPGAVAGWSLAVWHALAARRKWQVEAEGEVVRMVGEAMIVALDPAGALHLVTLRRPKPAA